MLTPECPATREARCQSGEGGGLQAKVDSAPAAAARRRAQRADTNPQGSDTCDIRSMRSGTWYTASPWNGSIHSNMSPLQQQPKLQTNQYSDSNRRVTTLSKFSRSGHNPDNRYPKSKSFPTHPERKTLFQNRPSYNASKQQEPHSIIISEQELAEKNIRTKTTKSDSDTKIMVAKKHVKGSLQTGQKSNYKSRNTEAAMRPYEHMSGQGSAVHNNLWNYFEDLLETTLRSDSEDSGSEETSSIPTTFLSTETVSLDLTIDEMSTAELSKSKKEEIVYTSDTETDKVPENSTNKLQKAKTEKIKQIPSYTIIELENEPPDPTSKREEIVYSPDFTGCLQENVPQVAAPTPLKQAMEETIFMPRYINTQTADLLTRVDLSTEQTKPNIKCKTKELMSGPSYISTRAAGSLTVNILTTEQQRYNKRKQIEPKIVPQVATQTLLEQDIKEPSTPCCTTQATPTPMNLSTEQTQSNNKTKTKEFVSGPSHISPEGLLTVRSLTIEQQRLIKRKQIESKIIPQVATQTLLKQDIEEPSITGYPNTQTADLPMPINLSTEQTQSNNNTKTKEFVSKPSHISTAGLRKVRSLTIEQQRYTRKETEPRMVVRRSKLFRGVKSKYLEPKKVFSSLHVIPKSRSYRKSSTPRSMRTKRREQMSERESSEIEMNAAPSDQFEGDAKMFSHVIRKSSKLPAHRWQLSTSKNKIRSISKLMKTCRISGRSKVKSNRKVTKKVHHKRKIMSMLKHQLTEKENRRSQFYQSLKNIADFKKRMQRETKLNFRTGIDNLKDKALKAVPKRKCQLTFRKLINRSNMRRKKIN